MVQDVLIVSRKILLVTVVQNQFHIKSYSTATEKKKSVGIYCNELTTVVYIHCKTLAEQLAPAKILQIKYIRRSCLGKKHLTTVKG